jgi:hypothetical protein
MYLRAAVTVAMIMKNPPISEKVSTLPSYLRAGGISHHKIEAIAALAE